MTLLSALILPAKGQFVRAGLLFAGLAAVVSSGPAQAQAANGGKPVLVITSTPMPASQPSPLYNRPSMAPEITPQQVINDAYFEPAETIVGQKIEQLRTDLFALQNRVGSLSEGLNALEKKSQAQAATYYASTATISTQLQSGTTPGNPRLVDRLSVAQANLDSLAQNIAGLNALAVEMANAASMGSFLLEAARATYGLSGAVEEDHMQLAQMEDQINAVIVAIDRLLTDVNDSITRTAAYLSSERGNLRTMALAVTNGDLYGRSLSNRPFSNAPRSDLLYNASVPVPAPMASVPPSPRPLVKIRFDRPDVDFEQPVYMAVNEAQEKYPQARFEVVAVHPTAGNAAQVAIESTRARRNAERVLRALTQMGLNLDNIDLSYSPSPDAATSEVHIFIR